MAWQFHYTSAEAGPTGRAGFQFVAESPGVPAGLSTHVAPYLTYRPPPGLPTAPSAQQIGAMPVAMAYGPAGDRIALTRCVYLGQDYSGRFGNFLGHALVLDDDDLVGLRPIELWRAPIWSDAPAAPGSALPELTDLAPGPTLDPESLGLWLRAGGPGAYDRLGTLLELTRQALTTGHGRLLLVSSDSEEIVRWIAVISYSLPWEVVKRLSFVTYSGDPAATAQTIVGTTPDVWLPSDLDATVLPLDQPVQRVGWGRFADTVTELWRRMNLAGIDELGTFGQADPETVAALVALCLSGASVSEEEQSAITSLIGGELPEWVWPAIGRRADRLGYELAAAVVAHGPPEAADPCAARCVRLALRDPSLAPPVGRLPGRYLRELSAAAGAELDGAAGLAHLIAVLRVADLTGLSLSAAGVERAVAAQVGEGLTGAVAAGEVAGSPLGWREVLLAGLVAGLERAAPGVRTRVMSAELCDLLAGHDLRDAPLTGVAVVRGRFAAGRIGRVDATIRLFRYGRGNEVPDERETTLAEIWRREPTDDDCLRLIDELGAAMQTSFTLCALPGRAFVRYGVKATETARIAERVRSAGIPGFPADDADAVLVAIGLANLESPRSVAAAVERLTGLTGQTDAALASLIRRRAAKTLAGRDPRFRTTLLLQLPDPSLCWLLETWLAAKPNRDEQAALLEIAIRVRLAGMEIAPLDEWARALVNGWTRFGSMENRFKNDPELAAGLKEFIRPKRWHRLRGGH